MRTTLASGGAGAAAPERPGSPARRPVLISTARPLASRQLARDRPVTSRLAATGSNPGDARGARAAAMPGSPLSAAMAWAPGSSGGRPGKGRTPVVRVHRGAPGRIRWPEAGPVPVSCSLAPAPASRARTPPMAGSWLAGSGGGRCAWIWQRGRLSASPRSRLGQVGDDAVGAALGAARAGRESRSRAPGSRAMHSSNRARPVRTLQLAALKNGHDF